MKNPLNYLKLELSVKFLMLKVVLSVKDFSPHTTRNLILN